MGRLRFLAQCAASGVALCAAVASTACTDASAHSDRPVTVFAASSLSDVFPAIGLAFEAAHPGTDVTFNFAGSSALAAQIEQAAPADVFATADMKTMAKAAARGLLEGEPVTFARNVPVIVVPADNRAGINQPGDLARLGTKIVLAGPEVPIGDYARQVIDRLAADPARGAAFRNAVLANIVSNEANVRAVLTKVELGEADAGMVYRTDAGLSGDRVETVEVPASAEVVAAYPIGLVRSARNPATARAFIDFVRGEQGQRLLAEAGFAPAK